MPPKRKTWRYAKDVDENLIIYANRDRIKQLLLNLIDNGIKYNKDGGRLYIKADAEKEMLKISVKDTGEGIAREDMPRLFERFYRVDKSRSKELGGTGPGAFHRKAHIRALRRKRYGFQPKGRTAPSL